MDNEKPSNFSFGQRRQIKHIKVSSRTKKTNKEDMDINIKRIKTYLSLVNQELGMGKEETDTPEKTKEMARFFKNFKELGADVNKLKYKVKNLRKKVEKIEKRLKKGEQEDSEDKEREGDDEQTESEESTESLKQIAKEFNRNTNILRMEEVKTNDGKTVKIFVVRQKKPGRRLKGEVFAKDDEVENIKKLIQEGKYDIKTGKFTGGARIRTILQRMDRQSEGKIRIRKEEESDDIEKEAEEEIEKEVAELRKKRVREVKEKMKKKKEKASGDIIQEEIEVVEPEKKKGRKKKEV